MNQLQNKKHYGISQPWKVDGRNYGGSFAPDYMSYLGLVCTGICQRHVCFAVQLPIIAGIYGMGKERVIDMKGIEGEDCVSYLNSILEKENLKTKHMLETFLFKLNSKEYSEEAYKNYLQVLGLNEDSFNSYCAALINTLI